MHVNDDAAFTKKEYHTRNFSLKMTELYEKYPPLKQSEIAEDNEMHLKLKAYHDELLRTSVLKEDHDLMNRGQRSDHPVKNFHCEWKKGMSPTSCRY